MIATLSRQSLDTLVAHAERDRPRECCGLLIGRGDPAAGERVEVLEAVPARNLAEDPDRFFVDPVDHIRARREARTRGLDVVGFYHSHSHSAARPSARGKLKMLRVFSWQNQASTGGIYHHLSPGIASDMAALSQRTKGRVHFAGEHLAVRHAGMEAALESGERIGRMLAARA